jgi:hypothetical protein
MAIVSANGAATPLSPNYIINGAMDFNQRGLTSTGTTTNGYTLDRWAFWGVSTTCSAQAFASGEAPISNWEKGTYIRLAVGSMSLADDYIHLQQPIEDVRTLSGQTVTLSFYAKAATGTPKIAVEFVQKFGTSGSTEVQSYAQQVVIGTSWVRYTVTANLPSIVSKTIGTGSMLVVNLWLSAGTTHNTRTGSLGFQSNTFNIWGVQLEAGSIATPFRRNANSIQGELAACQRYYWRSNNTGTGNYAPVGTGIGKSSTQCEIYIPFPTPMRVVPTSMDYNLLSLWDGTTQSTLNTISLQPNNTSTTATLISASSQSGLTQYRPYQVIGNNSTNAYIGFSAEL